MLTAYTVLPHLLGDEVGFRYAHLLFQSVAGDLDDLEIIILEHGQTVAVAKGNKIPRYRIVATLAAFAGWYDIFRPVYMQ